MYIQCGGETDPFNYEEEAPFLPLPLTYAASWMRSPRESLVRMPIRCRLVTSTSISGEGGEEGGLTSRRREDSWKTQW